MMIELPRGETIRVTHAPNVCLSLSAVRLYTSWALATYRAHIEYSEQTVSLFVFVLVSHNVGSM